MTIHPDDVPQLVARLASVLRVERTEDLRPEHLKFLIEELADSHERLRTAYDEDHGGRPAVSRKADEWHFHRQFRADVWSPYTSHRLQLIVIAANLAAAAEFVTELRHWCDFIDSTIASNT